MKSYKYAGYEYLPSEYTIQRCVIVFGRLANRSVFRAMMVFVGFEFGFLTSLVTYTAMKGIAFGTMFSPALISGMFFFFMAISFGMHLAFQHGKDEARRAHEAYVELSPEVIEHLKGHEYGKHIPTRIDRRSA